MLKKLAKLALRYAVDSRRHGPGGYGKPWGKPWKHDRRYGSYGPGPYGPSPYDRGYGYDHRPRDWMGMLIEAVLRRLTKR